MSNYEGENNGGCMRLLISGSIVIAGLSILPIVHGYVLVKLWVWFIVPTFGLASLSLVKAIGVNLLVSFLMARVDTEDFNKKEDNLEPLIMKFLWQLVIVPLFYLLFGYVVSLWM
jgi:hypothetical protein